MNDQTLIKKYLPKDKWDTALKKLNDGYPVQYIIGNVEFYNTIINVNENVLIPRFETEYLVDNLIKLIKEKKYNNPLILDIGTGSGCIAIALKKNISCDVTAIDASKKALVVAQENANYNKSSIDFMCEKIETFQSNKTFDIIVSNPPYVAYDEIVDQKTKYEPQEAIFAKENGLYFYKIILDKSKKLLNKKGIIAFEIGQSQAQAIKDLAQGIYPHSLIIVKKDLDNKDRYLFVINE